MTTIPKPLLSMEFVLLAGISFFAFCNMAVFYGFYDYLETIGIPVEWRGVLLDLDTIDRQDLDLSGLNRVCGHWDRYPGTQPDQVRERIRGAQVVVTNKVVLDRPILESAADLRLVCVAATGTNNLDLVARPERHAGGNRGGERRLSEGRRRRGAG